MKAPEASPLQKAKQPQNSLAQSEELQSMQMMRPPVFQLQTGAGADAHENAHNKAQDKPYELTSDDHEALISGKLLRDGAFETLPKFRFTNGRMEAAYQLVRTKFNLTDVTPVQDDKKPQVGDSPGKDPDDIPAWVQQLTQKLTDTYPNAAGLDPYKHNVYKNPATAPGETWSEIHTKAQRLLEAFYHAWYSNQRQKDVAKKKDKGEKSDLPEKAAGNVEELFSRVGSSKNNKRAQTIGETPQAIYGWCGPASQFALAISLMRKGFRFKTGKGPLMPKVHKPAKIEVPKEVEKEPYKGYNKNRDRIIEMVDKEEKRVEMMNRFEIANAIRLEIAAQGAYFLSSWAVAGYGKKGTKKAGQVVDKDLAHRQVGGQGNTVGSAWIAPLKQGDYITLIMKNSPLSGHIATVIREERNEPKDKEKGYQPGEEIGKIYMVSGNAKNSSVRVEVVTREMPVDGYDWGEFSAAGNRYTEKKQAIKNAESKMNKASGGGNLYSALIAAIEGNKTLRGEMRKKYPMGYMDYFKSNWGNAAIIKPVLQQVLPGKVAEYEASLKPELVEEWDKAKTEADKWRKEKGDEGIKVDKSKAFESSNGAKEKQATPTDPAHAWIVNIVRSSDLDANRIHDEINASTQSAKDAGGDGAKAKDEVLSKYGLEQLPEGYADIFKQGMDYWEPKGGFM